ncbi:hypothetical protein CAY59_06530 [Vibrio campbellii]|nr:hypothetical protein CAY59_06530 [Vibrio campbellii]
MIFPIVSVCSVYFENSVQKQLSQCLTPEQSVFYTCFVTWITLVILHVEHEGISWFEFWSCLRQR